MILIDKSVETMISRMMIKVKIIWKDELIDGETDEQKDERTDGEKDELTDGSKDEITDERRDNSRTKELINSRTNFPTVDRTDGRDDLADGRTEVRTRGLLRSPTVEDEV